MPVVTNDSFRKIRVESNAGAVQGVIAADQALDTLTFVAGLGITITPNETGDKLVINTVGSVNTADINDILFNGNTTNFGLTVGSLTVDSILLDTNTVSANHASNDLILTTSGSGSIALNKTAHTRSIIPQADVTYDLGSADKRFKDLYLSGSTIYLGSATISTTGSTVVLPAGSTVAGTSFTDTVLPTQTSNDNKFLRTNGATVYWADIPTQFPDQTGATGKSLTSNGSTVQWTLITPTTLGLGNVTNESKVTMFTDSALTGTPTAPTAVAGTNTTQLATTEFVGTAVSNLIDAAPSALDTLNELAAALGDDANYASTVTTALGTKAPIANPTFTGTAVIPTLQLTNVLGLSYGGTGAASAGDALTNLMPAGATAGYVLKTGGSGSYYWAAETGASTIVGTRIDTQRQTFTATAAQALFTFTSASYTPGAGQLRVFIGGVRQHPDAYAETNSTSFTLSAGVNAGTKVFAEVDGYVSNTVTATAVVVTPVGNVGSTNVQDALSELDTEKAPKASPTFTGTVSGITSTMVGLGNVTNESKATMFTSPTFTGTVAGVTATMVGLDNVTNESKATMFTDPSFTGTVTVASAVSANGSTGSSGQFLMSQGAGAAKWSNPSAFTEIAVNPTVGASTNLDCGGYSELEIFYKTNGSVLSDHWLIFKNDAVTPTAMSTEHQLQTFKGVFDGSSPTIHYFNALDWASFGTGGYLYVKAGQYSAYQNSYAHIRVTGWGTSRIMISGQGYCQSGSSQPFGAWSTDAMMATSGGNVARHLSFIVNANSGNCRVWGRR